MFERLRQILQLFSIKDLRNGILGVSVVLGGLGLAFLTMFAHRSGDVRLAGIAATASLVFVLLIIIFVIPPLARSASAEASQLNLPFEFTTGGAVFVGLLVIVAFAAWNTGNNLLFLVLSFVTGALITGFLVGNFCLRKLDVKMRFPDTIFAGEETPILVSLHNRKRFFPAFSVTAEVRGKNRSRSAFTVEIEQLLPKQLARRFSDPPLIKYTLDYFVHIPRRDYIENKVEHVFPRRGRFLIKDFELSTKFPFAFFRHRRRLPAQRAEIFVFPKLEPLELEMIDIPVETGKLAAKRRGAGQDLLALREYKPLDDLRYIDWKATARSGGVMVREFAAEDEKRVTVILDTRMILSEKERRRSLRRKISDEKNQKKFTASERRFENAASKAASLLTHFAEDQSEIRLVIDGGEGEFGIGKQTLHKFMRELATIDPTYVEGYAKEELDDNFADVLNDERNSHIFFITAMPAGDLPGEIFSRSVVVQY
ncbi:MAG: DUF58 domain-containing protein [Acidobacteria bacterium]|nr:MAG: DUF58 domain-containing protein [Acidobacteriota bacterium]REK02566.1 MAG: DUF58 domain-containing protein [Acidobacteriota bacterium]REK13631.1 MAG: DUF58 domain-containing protein [Acidobacteriota bacterium]REK41625.1 MAG: DUF58 domain-containing protein [Acidobacteriota bacterium]